MRSIVIALFCFTVLACGQAGAATRSMCPDKVLDKGTVEGIFQGVECGDSCSGAVKLPSGEDFSFFISEEQAEEVFGGGTGQKVSVTYEVQQLWRVEDPDGDPNNGWCQRSEVFVAGKVLAAASAQGKKEKSSPTAQKKKPVEIKYTPDSCYSVYRTYEYITGTNINSVSDNFGLGDEYIINGGSFLDLTDGDFDSIYKFVSLCHKKEKPFYNPKYTRDEFLKIVKNQQSRINKGIEERKSAELAARERKEQQRRQNEDKARQKDATQSYIAENTNAALALLKNSYFASYPKSHGYPSIGKALEKFFARPTWEITPGKLGALSSGWIAKFHGIAELENGNKARFTWAFFIDVKEVQEGKIKDVSYDQFSVAGFIGGTLTAPLSVNNNPASIEDINDTLAVIFLN